MSKTSIIKVVCCIVCFVLVVFVAVSTYMIVMARVSPKTNIVNTTTVNSVSTDESAVEKSTDDLTVESLRSSIGEPIAETKQSILSASDDEVEDSADGPISQATLDLWNLFEDNDQQPTVETVRTAIQNDADVNAAQDIGITSLHVAVRQNASVEVVEELIANGAVVDARDMLGHTPLWLACFINANVDIIQALINHGADVNAKSDYGRTPLFSACFNGVNATIVKTLIDAGANVNARDDVEWTPLLFACSHNADVEIIQMLIDARADVNATNNRGRTPLIIACLDTAEVTVAKALIDAGANVNVTNSKGKTMLDAVTNAEVIALLKKNGAVRSTVSTADTDVTVE